MTHTSRPLAALGTLLLVNGALVGIPWLVAPAEAFSDTAAMWQYAVYQQVFLVALVGLALLLPTLGRLTAPDGRRLAGWVVPVLTVGVLLQAATTFVQGFVAPFLATVSPGALDLEDGGLFAASMTVAWLIFLVSLAALARGGLPATGAAPWCLCAARRRRPRGARPGPDRQHPGRCSLRVERTVARAARGHGWSGARRRLDCRS
jgi:hypothetical protein